MANKSKKIKDLILDDNFDYDTIRQELDGSRGRFNEMLSLLINAVQIDRTDGKLLPFRVERFIKRTLIENNCIGLDMLLDKPDGRWAQATIVGKLDAYGDPKTLELKFGNGRSASRPVTFDPKDNTGAYFIIGTPGDFCFGKMIKDTCDTLIEIDTAIMQNIEACKTAKVVICRDPKLKLSLQTALNKKHRGQAVVVVTPELAEGLKAEDIKAEFLADKFLEVRDKVLDKLMNKLGIMSANINKKERVQVGEVNAITGQCMDYIYMLIDTFNKQMETYELPYEMKLNASLEELYADGEDDPDDKDNKKKGEEAEG